MKKTGLLSVVLTALLAVPAAHAEVTRVLVRAISRDAKIIGDGVGGALISIRDTRGHVLAQGKQTGTTGETASIMEQPRKRGATVYATPEAAGFVAELQLIRPTLVEISAEGPLKFPHAMQRAAKRMLLIPGQHIEGEGVLLEIHGFIVEILEPEGAAPWVAGQPREVNARVRMTCGCPTKPGGMWNSDRYSIVARLRQGDTVTEERMVYSGEESVFETFFIPAAGRGELEILVSDPAEANFGMVSGTIEVAAAP